MSSLLNRLVVHSIRFMPKMLVRRFAARYIAGDTLDDAVALVKDLNRRGIMATLDVLGESIHDLKDAERAVGEYERALAAIQAHGLDCNVSLKPSQFGLHLAPEAAHRHIEGLVARAGAQGNFVRIDMEDSSLTQATLDLYRDLRLKHPGRVGTVVQAYLRRTFEDVMALIADGPTNLRLCKGIYVEPRELAWKAFDIVRENFVAVLEAALDRGAYLGIATHDEWLFFQADRIIRARGLDPTRFEFQMLLGVDEEMQDLILARGYRLRLYVPYGPEWYAYSVRRLRENPQVAMYVAQAFFERLLGRRR